MAFRSERLKGLGEPTSHSKSPAADEPRLVADGGVRVFFFRRLQITLPAPPLTTRYRLLLLLLHGLQDILPNSVDSVQIKKPLAFGRPAIRPFRRGSARLISLFSFRYNFGARGSGVVIFWIDTR